MKNTYLIGTRVNPEEKDELQRLAAKEDRSLSSLLRQIIRRYVKEAGE